MPSLLDDTLFSEPSGTGVSLVHFGSAVAFSLMLGYSWLRAGPPTNYWLVFMIVGTALVGVAEALPTARTRAAGVFRLAGIGTIGCLLGILVFSPELIV
jgi:hypothetical protein